MNTECLLNITNTNMTIFPDINPVDHLSSDFLLICSQIYFIYTPFSRIICMKYLFNYIRQNTRYEKSTLLTIDREMRSVIRYHLIFPSLQRSNRQNDINISYTIINCENL